LITFKNISIIILLSFSFYSCEKHGENTFLFEELHISTLNLIDISFLNDEIGIILGTSNSLFITKDSGISWDYIYADIDDYVSKIEFCDSNSIILVGYYLYKSVDFGTSWTKLSSWDKSSRIHNIFFLNKDSYEEYTRKGIPWKLLWKMQKLNRIDAMILERKLKNL